VPCHVKSSREVCLYTLVNSIDFVELEEIYQRRVLCFSHLKEFINSQFLGMIELFDGSGKSILSFCGFQSELSRKPVCFPEEEAVLLAELGALIDRFIEPESHKHIALYGLG